MLLILIHPTENVILLYWAAVFGKPLGLLKLVLSPHIVALVRADHSISVHLLDEERGLILRQTAFPRV